MAVFSQGVDVSFGDCDPAGIVFYPNYFRWMDATFHRLLSERAGGHAQLCRQLEAKGIGLMEARLSFRSPATEGQHLDYRITQIEWGGRSLVVSYEADVAGRRVLDGMERRGVFVMSDGHMSAANVEGLKQALGF